MPQVPPRLRFDHGSLVWEADPSIPTPPGFLLDDRIRRARAPALIYRETVEWLRAQKIAFTDDARAWKPLSGLVHLIRQDTRPYQKGALEAWKDEGGRGVVVLPTGAGKTYVAELCLLEVQRPVLVIVPTIDLLIQWHHRFSIAFDQPVGMLGGGSHDVQDITICTYASAYLHVERIGNRFGLVVFDEVHHLPAENYRLIAECMLAPYRLGLSATPERSDDAHLLLDELVGPEVYRRGIGEMAGDWLAEYETVRLWVELPRAEQQAYDEARRVYRAFVKSKGINMSDRENGWSAFVQAAARSREGREAFKAWQEARRIAHRTDGKLDLLEDILREEAGRRTLIFTDDNATAYRISREFLVPIITHQTHAKERTSILQGLADGTAKVVVTSRVLNEGVDMPEAEVAVVVSGTGSVREHVQRLGRILRPGNDKQAVLYEMVTLGTAEERTSDRRRDHEAYR